MKNILRSGAVLAMVLGLGACGGKADEAIGKMKALKDEMCACKDKACADKVTEKMMKLDGDNKDTKGSPEQVKEATKIAEEMMKCMMKLQMPDGAPPAAPPAAPPG